MNTFCIFYNLHYTGQYNVTFHPMSVRFELPDKTEAEVSIRSDREIE